MIKHSYADPTGRCDECGITYYGDRHNHCPIKTFTAAEAVALWTEPDAAESRE